MTTSNLSLRVAARFQRWAMEHPSPEARQEYLKEHPHADPVNHTVKKPSGGHGHGEEAPKRTWAERFKSLGDKAKNFVKGAPAEVKKFIENDAHRRKTLTAAHETLVTAPEKVVKNLIATVKHEVHEFKEAGQGVAAVLKGGKMSKEQKKAFKTVSFHLALTAAATVLTASGGPLMAAGAFGKSIARHVAVKSVSRAMAHLHVLDELGHVGHGLSHILDKLAAEEKKRATPEDVMARFVMANVAKELEELDGDGIAEALENMEDPPEKR